MPFFSAAATYCASAMHAGPLIVIEVVISPMSMPSKSSLHIGERVDRNAAFADFAARLRRIRVVAHQRRHIEGDREPVLALLEQKMISFVGLRRVAEPRKLTHRPQAVAIAVGMDAPRVWILARLGKIEPGSVLRAVEPLERHVGNRPVDRTRTRSLARPARGRPLGRRGPVFHLF